MELNPFSHEFHADPYPLYRRLRDEAPLYYNERYDFWALTRFADVMQVSRDPDTFRSAPTSTVGDIPVEIAEWLGSIINMDAPKHTRLRLIVNRGFTPRQVAGIEESVRQQAKEIVDRVADRGECDFVSEIAAALPLQVICDMMGIPREDTKMIFDHTNVILGVGDPEYVQSMEDLMAAGMGLFQYGIALAQERRDNPRDDIASKLIHAEVEDEHGELHRLTNEELGSFFLLLVVAGNETTRNAISHGLRALTDHPDQRRVWQADFEGVAPTAIEEIVRWATPVISFRRTVTQDVRIGARDFTEGEKVVMYYNSANRDERQFERPFEFDITRSPNPHFGYGGGGAHFCLGANLARREIRVMFEEIFRVLPDLHITGEPEMLQSGFIHGIKRMPCAFTPTA